MLTPNTVIRTEDGYKFTVQSDGTLTDGDLTIASEYSMDVRFEVVEHGAQIDITPSAPASAAGRRLFIKDRNIQLILSGVVERHIEVETDKGIQGVGWSILARLKAVLTDLQNAETPCLLTVTPLVFELLAEAVDLQRWGFDGSAPFMEIQSQFGLMVPPKASRDDEIVPNVARVSILDMGEDGSRRTHVPTIWIKGPLTDVLMTWQQARLMSHAIEAVTNVGEFG